MPSAKDRFVFRLRGEKHGQVSVRAWSYEEAKPLAEAALEKRYWTKKSCEPPFGWELELIDIEVGEVPQLQPIE